MARKAPWEVAFDAKPADYERALRGPEGRRWVFEWRHGARVQPASSGWRRLYEVYPPRDCRKGHARTWSEDGLRARCTTCDAARQRRHRVREKAAECGVTFEAA